MDADFADLKYVAFAGICHAQIVLAEASRVLRRTESNWKLENYLLITNYYGEGQFTSFVGRRAYNERLSWQNARWWEFHRTRIPYL